MATVIKYLGSPTNLYLICVSISRVLNTLNNHLQWVLLGQRLILILSLLNELFLMGSGGDIKDRGNTGEKNCFQVLSYSQKNMFN